MSFEAQENLLLELLFNQTLRKRFLEDSNKFLNDYSLSNEEKEDFYCIRPDALLMDASMRSNIVLRQLCKALPISFSIYSSLPDGLTTLVQLISPDLMKQKLEYRPVIFAERLIETLNASWIPGKAVMEKIIQVINTEKQLAYNKYLVIQAGNFNHNAENNPPTISKKHLDLKLSLAPFVIFTELPLSYSELKSSLCPKPDAQLWNHLQQHPLTTSIRDSLFENNEPRLLISRASITTVSDCDPVIDHFTVELSHGFKNILTYLECKPSINEILAQMQHVGADIHMMQSIQNTLLQLIESKLLILEKK